MSQHERFIAGLRVVIETANTRPPIPERKYDWCATTSDYEPGHPVGHGATEEAAIADLIEKLENV